MEEIPYSGYRNSMWFMYMMLLGETDTEAFGYANGQESKYLFALFIMSTFFFLIHLLNMLIAIMTVTFENRRMVETQIRFRDRLTFVMHNWHLQSYALKDPKRMKYIIAAFPTSYNEQEDQLETLKTNLTNFEGKQRENFFNVMTTINQIQAHLNMDKKEEKQRKMSVTGSRMNVSILTDESYGSENEFVNK